MDAKAIFVVLMLTAPKYASPPSEASCWIEACRPEFLAACLELEIIDRREVSHFLVGDMLGDLASLKTRASTFNDVPLLRDCDRLPHWKAVNEYLAFNRTFRDTLVTRRMLCPVHNTAISEAIADVDRAHAVWNVVRDARCEYYYVTVRRQALQLLKERIGAEAYHRMSLPPHVPLWAMSD